MARPTPAVAGHVPVNDQGFAVSGIEAANSGQKCLEHMYGPFPGDPSMPQLMDVLKQNHTWVDPTLIVYWASLHFKELPLKNYPHYDYTAPKLKKWWGQQTRDFSSNLKIPQLLFEARKSGLKTLYDAGVPLLAGTDLGFANILPGDIH